jgi:hypothetical protein
MDGCPGEITPGFLSIPILYTETYRAADWQLEQKRGFQKLSKYCYAAARQQDTLRSCERALRA